MRLITKAIIITTLTFMTKANAADKWHIGFNEPFVTGYMQSIGYTCFGCPGNTYTASYNQISSRLLDLASNQHVGMYREIIPVSMLHPAQNEIRHSAAIDLLALYSDYDLNLVIAFGLPIPQWMISNNNVLQPMPSDDIAWNTLKNHLAKEMGDFALALWNSPKIRRDWLQTRVFIEGFNEFDSIQDSSGSNIYSSPTRAADLQNGIQWYLNYYDLPIQTLMPSLAGVYSGSGYSSLTPSQKIGTFMVDYYAASGSGWPNAHIYTGPNSTESAGYTEMLNKVRDSINVIW